MMVVLILVAIALMGLSIFLTSEVNDEIYRQR